jgi:hypothetical protein
LSSQEICSKCKSQIINFFTFKKRNEDARKKLQNIQQEIQSTYSEDEQTTEILEETEINENQLETKKGRRKSKPENWMRNQRKYAKNSGQSYVTSNGKCVEAKQMKGNCGENCRIKCSSKITEDKRKMSFDHFYALADIVKQRKFLFDHMRSYEPKKLKHLATSQKGRTIQRHYFLDVEKEGVIEDVQVCKHMFLNTFSISSQMIDTIYKKLKADNEFNDIRGKFPRKRSISLSRDDE